MSHRVGLGLSTKIKLTRVGEGGMTMKDNEARQVLNELIKQVENLADLVQKIGAKVNGIEQVLSGVQSESEAQGELFE
jgi:hypothetical protein